MADRDERTEEPGRASMSNDVVTSQIAYYRAHAPRYDDWWLRERRHDFGDEFRQKWTSEISRLRISLSEVAPFGEVLEFAGGTGNWTVELARVATSITVVDSSRETADIAREKVATGNVTWVIQNIFDYRPERLYDTVFFSFWLSHVPPELFDRFWSLVADCVAPGGRVVFIDNAHPSLPGNEHEFPTPADPTSTSVAGIDGVTDLTTGISTRLAADGSTYDLIKIWRTPDDLETRLKTLGWDIRVSTTDWAFIFGHGSRIRKSSKECPRQGD
jgi:SAM-dependent methyltransferase